MSRQEASPLLGESRRQVIEDMLRENGAVTVAQIEERFGVSQMTARRDLGDLERRGVARRTHGGAVMPLTSSHEDSFAKRLERSTPAKDALALAAVARLVAYETVFLDSSTTSFHVAQCLLETGLSATVLTNCLPIMDLVSSHAAGRVELIGLGGTLRRRTRSFVGPSTVAAIEAHFADRVFVSVKGIASTGALTDADPLEAEVKRAMIRQAAESVLLIDETKLNHRGLNAITPLRDLSAIIVHGAPTAELARLRASGVEIEAIGD